ncbi:hypothetical protein DFJ73DRAFT_792434 [Zopfochytrium polystomum]|nr:hypothetical protein DFJ73DRAFT_792434 [Zopfochytrium polystomum]
MASNVTVELDGEPLKRTSVKTTPNMALKAVAVAACERLKLDGSVDAYRLKYQKNFLDLSLSVRFANLPAGAKLILVRQASSSSSSSSNPAAAAPQPRVQQVSIALQTEEGARLLGKFPNNVSFWAVMRHFEGLDPQLNLTRREAPPPQKDRSGIPKALHAIAEAGRLAAPKVYLQPTIVLMTREFSSIEVLRSTTLMDAGLQTGSSMLRLLYKYTDEPLATFLPQIQAADDAAASASKPQPAAPPAAPSSSSSSSSSSTTPTAAPPPAAARPAPADVRPPAAAAAATAIEEPNRDSSKNPPAAVADTVRSPEGASVVAAASSPPAVSDGGAGAAAAGAAAPAPAAAMNVSATEFDRGLKFFKPPPDTAPVAIDLPDSFFELTSAEIKALMQSSKARAEAAANAPLMTKALREREDELRRQKHPKTLIRVRFPDRTTLQAAFLSNEPVGAIYALVQSHLADASRAFVLYTPPTQVYADSRDDVVEGAAEPGNDAAFPVGRQGRGLVPAAPAATAQMQDFPVPVEEAAASDAAGAAAAAAVVGRIPGLPPAGLEPRGRTVGGGGGGGGGSGSGGRDGRGQPQRRWWWGGKERGCGRAQGAKVVQDWQVIERGNIRLRPSSSRLLPPPSITVRELQHFSPWPLRNKRVQD